MSVAACGLIPAALLLVFGCEDNAAQDTVGTPPPAVAALRISPASKTIYPSNTVANFRVVGGTPPYRWSVSDTSMGTVPDVNASAVAYTRAAGKYGINVVSVFDKNDWGAVAYVTQTDTSPSTNRSARLGLDVPKDSEAP